MQKQWHSQELQLCDHASEVRDLPPHDLNCSAKLSVVDMPLKAMALPKQAVMLFGEYWKDGKAKPCLLRDTDEITNDVISGLQEPS